jgi:hypothetical protein
MEHVSPASRIVIARTRDGRQAALALLDSDDPVSVLQEHFAGPEWVMAEVRQDDASIGTFRRSVVDDVWVSTR